jgi:aspartate/tyrosine/aromatic aminotransferase
MRRCFSSASRWSGIPQTAADPILGLVAAFKEDPAPRKVNLAQGAYRTDAGEPLVLDVVREAEQRIAADASLNKEYLPVEGLAEFRQLSAEFVFGESSAALAEKRVATVQSLSGTGALRICANFLARFDETTQGRIHLPAPSWGNHHNIFKAGGLEVESYGYVDKSGTALDFNAMKQALATEVNHFLIFSLL